MLLGFYNISTYYISTHSHNLKEIEREFSLLGKMGKCKNSAQHLLCSSWYGGSSQSSREGATSKLPPQELHSASGCQRFEICL